MMRLTAPLLPVVLALGMAGCASDLHLRTASGNRALPAPGTTNVGGAVEIRSASSSMAAVLVGLGIYALAIQGELPPARPAAAALDPGRSISEQDCTRPIELSGNLRCR